MMKNIQPSVMKKTQLMLKQHCILYTYQFIKRWHSQDRHYSTCTSWCAEENMFTQVWFTHSDS